jgi:hypothetical protein
MENSWQDVVFVTTLFALGILGFFGITLLPLRSAKLLRSNLLLWRTSPLGKVTFTVLAFVAIAAIAFAFTCTVKVSRCLLGYHCSADRSGGWLYLAQIGFLYALFETLAFLVLFAGRKLSRVTT